MITSLLLSLAMSFPAQAIVKGTLATNEDLISKKTGLLFVADVEGCTFTVVNKRVLLTAAHCFLNYFTSEKQISKNLNKVNIYFSLHKSFEENSSFYGSRDAYQPAKILIHPKFDRKTINTLKLDYDVALVILDKDIPYDYSPVQIRYDFDRSLPIQAAGYGQTYLNDPQNNSPLRISELLTVYGNRTNTIQIDQQAGKSGICLGDSGGPLFVQVENEIHQYGVASFRGDRKIKSKCKEQDGIGGFLKEKICRAGENLKEIPCGNTAGFFELKAAQEWIQESLSTFSEEPVQHLPQNTASETGVQ